MVDPVTAMILGWIGEWTTSKVAETLLGGVRTKLNPSDLDKSLGAAAKAAQEQEERLFSNCEPHLIPRFLGQFFKGSGLQELQKPLNNQGILQVDFLATAFIQTKKNHPKMQGKIDETSVKPWMEVFVRTYFEQTNTYLRFQVAKEDYFTQLANWFDDVKFAGIAVEGQEVEKSEKLAQIFVMPDVVEEVQTRPADLAFEPDLTLRDADGRVTYLQFKSSNRQAELLREQRERARLQNFSERKSSATQLLSQSQLRRLVLLGAPGSGKTTLMSYFAVMLAQQQPERVGLAADIDWLPILIRIRDLARHPDIGILEYARQFARTAMSVQPLPADFFEYWLEDGRALILLDGLDEIAEAGKRHEVVKRIEGFLGQFDRNRAIVTSRPAGYRRDFFRTDEFPHYQLQPFDDPKIEGFINRWYDSRVSDPAEAQRRKDSLRRALTENDRIKPLARNPLLLTIIALIHRYQAYLPKQRYKLYDKSVETLLTSWDANRELTNHAVLKYLGLYDLRRLMEGLARWIHQHGSTGDEEGGTLIDRDKLICQLGEDIETLKGIQLYEAKEEAKKFINFIRDRTGLLNEQGQDCYAFVHKTFQEYLCAQEIDYQADNEDDFNKILDCIDTHLHDPHWWEVLLLLIAQQKPKKVAKAIQKILDHQSPYESWLHRDLLFAGSCLAENPKDLRVSDNGLSKEILEKLVELEVSDSPQVTDKIRSQVFQTLCSLSETDFETQTLQLLKDSADRINKPDKSRLQEYQVALGEKEAAIETLLALLRDENSDVRSSAANALVSLGNPSEPVLQELLALLKDENSFARSSAAYALVSLGKISSVVNDVAEWIEQHQDAEYVGSGIDALWDLVVGEQS